MIDREPMTGPEEQPHNSQPELPGIPLIPEPELMYSFAEPADAPADASGGNIFLLTNPNPKPLSPDEDDDFDDVDPLRPRDANQLEKARRRQEVYLQKRREKKKRRVFYSRVRGVVRLICAILLFAGLYLTGTAGFWQFSAPYFSLHGNQLITREALAQFVVPMDRKPIYLINPMAMQKQILKNIPLIQSVHIRRHLFPVGLDIMVAEKPSWGVLYTQAPGQAAEREKPAAKAGDKIQNAATTTESVAKPLYLLHWDNTWTDLAAYHLAPKDYKRFDEAIPLVADANQMNRLSPAILNRYRDMAQYLSSEPKLAKLQYLDISNPFDIYAVFDGFKIRIGRADSSLMSRLERMFPLVATIREHQPELQFVDLRWNQQIIFKKKPKDQLAQEKQAATHEAVKATNETAPASH